MGYDKRYNSNAERQRAYRARCAAVRPPSTMQRAEALHQAIEAASAAGDEKAASLLGEAPIATLANVVRYWAERDRALSEEGA